MQRRSSSSGSSSSSYSLSSSGSIVFDIDAGTGQQQPADLQSQASSLDGSIDIDVAVANFEAMRRSAPSCPDVLTPTAPRPKPINTSGFSLTAEPPQLSTVLLQQGTRPSAGSLAADSPINLRAASHPEAGALSRPPAVNPHLSVGPPVSPHAHSPALSPNTAAAAAAVTAVYLQTSPGRAPHSPAATGGHSPATVMATRNAPKHAHADAKHTGMPQVYAGGAGLDDDRRSAPPRLRSPALTPARTPPAPQDSDRDSNTRTSTPTVLVPPSPTAAAPGGRGMLPPRAHQGAALSPTMHKRNQAAAAKAPPGALPHKTSGGVSPSAFNKPASSVNISPLRMSDMATAKRMDLGAPGGEGPQPRSSFTLVGHDGRSTLKTQLSSGPPPDSLPISRDPMGKFKSPPRQRSSRPQLLPELEAQRCEAGHMLVGSHVAQELGLSGRPACQQLTQSASMRSSTPGRGERPAYVQWSFRHREPRGSNTGGADPDLAHLSHSEAA